VVFILILVAVDLFQYVLLVRLLLEEPALLPGVGCLPGPGLGSISRLEAVNEFHLSLPVCHAGRQQLRTRAFHFGTPAFALDTLIELLLRLATDLPSRGRNLVVERQGLVQQPRPLHARPEFRGSFVRTLASRQRRQLLRDPGADVGHFAVFIPWLRHENPP